MRAWRSANVSPRLIHVVIHYDSVNVIAFFIFSVFDQCPHKNHHQPRRRPSLRYAPNVAPSRNLEKTVVVVAAVPGSKAVEVLATQDFGTRGPRAYRHAKHGHSSGQRSAIRKMLLSTKALSLLMVLTR